MKFQPHLQSTCESCLASCLLQLRYYYAGKKFNNNLERKMLFASFLHNREDFVAGHLAFYFKHLKLRTERYVHNNTLFNWAKKVPGSKLIQQKVSLAFIDKQLNEGPIICLLDYFALSKGWCHYPHWVVIYDKDKSNYLVYDPQKKDLMKLSEKTIKMGLNTLLTKLWMAPQAIKVKIKN